MTRMQVVLIIAVNAVISALISIGVTLLLQQPEVTISGPFGEFFAKRRTQLGDPLLELGLEAGVVHLIQLSKIGAVGCVHLIEPIHQLVGELLAKSLVKGL